MPTKETDLRPVDHITADAIGQPGKRVFYIQGWLGDRSITLLVEKFQLQSLAVGYEQFLAEINQKNPELTDASAEYDEQKMHIHPPVDPLFRIGELSLGYDSQADLVVLIASQAVPDAGEEGDLEVVRFWCTRSQLRALCHWSMELAARGRPICPQCGEPMEPEGHFCPKRNGHQH